MKFFLQLGVSDQDTSKWVELLKVLYPDRAISAVAGGAPALNIRFGNQILLIDLQTKTVTPCPPWPSIDEIQSNLPSNDDSEEETQNLLSKIDLANQSGNWSEAKNYLEGLDKDEANDAIRKVLTALYKCAGSDLRILNGLLKMMPEEMRQAMIDVMKEDNGYHEGEERHEGEHGIRRMASVIQHSFD